MTTEHRFALGNCFEIGAVRRQLTAIMHDHGIEASEVDEFIDRAVCTGGVLLVRLPMTREQVAEAVARHSLD